MSPSSCRPYLPTMAALYVKKPSSMGSSCAVRCTCGAATAFHLHRQPQLTGCRCPDGCTARGRTPVVGQRQEHGDEHAVVGQRAPDDGLRRQRGRAHSVHAALQHAHVDKARQAACCVAAGHLLHGEALHQALRRIDDLPPAAQRRDRGVDRRPAPCCRRCWSGLCRPGRRSGSGPAGLP